VVRGLLRHGASEKDEGQERKLVEIALVCILCLSSHSPLSSLVDPAVVCSACVLQSSGAS